MTRYLNNYFRVTRRPPPRLVGARYISPNSESRVFTFDDTDREATRRAFSEAAAQQDRWGRGSRMCVWRKLHEDTGLMVLPVIGYNPIEEVS